MIVAAAAAASASLPSLPAVAAVALSVPVERRTVTHIRRELVRERASVVILARRNIQAFARETQPAVVTRRWQANERLAKAKETFSPSVLSLAPIPSQQLASLAFLACARLSRSRLVNPREAHAAAASLPRFVRLPALSSSSSSSSRVVVAL